MADIFFSYAREDRERVVPLIRWLEDAGYSVWWDREIQPGSAFDDTIESQIAQAQVVLVVWSQASVRSNWVQAEANEGLERGALLPLRLDDVRPPMPFRSIQMLDLLGYPRRPNTDQLTQLKAQIAAQLLAPSEAVPSSVLPRRRWPALAVLSIIALGIGVQQWLDRSFKVTDGYFIEPFSAPSTEMEALLQALGEEVAQELRKSGQLSVTLDDGRAIPTAARVSGRADDNQLVISVRSLSSGEPVFERGYGLGAGLNQVHNRVANDLSTLAGKRQSLAPVPSSDIYRDYLAVAALMRDSPTQSRLAQAKQSLEEIITKAPNFARAHGRLCDLELQLYSETASREDFESAEVYCERALEISDGDLEVMLAYARLRMMSGQPEAALKLLDRALQQRPRSAAVALQFGLAHERLGNDEDALRAYLRSVEMEPDNWRGYNQLGAFHFGRGEYEQAAEYYNLETALVRDKSRSLNNVGSALFMQGDLDGALAAWHESLREEPGINTLLNLGSAAFFAKDFAAAARYYQQARVQAPEDQRIVGHLADTQAAMSDPASTETYEQAVALARSALQLDRAKAGVRGDLAAYLAALGQTDAALEALADIADIVSNVDIEYDRALVYVRLQQSEALARQVEKLRTLGYPEHMLERDWNLQIGQQ